MSITDIIEVLDNDEQIINQEFDGLLIWPTVRFILIQHLIDKINHLDSPKSQGSRQGVFTQILGLIESLFSCPIFGPDKPTLIFNTELSNIKNEEGLYYNRISNDFYEVDQEDTWIIENPVGLFHSKPKKHKTYSKLSFNIFLEVKAKFTLRFNKGKVRSAQKKIDDLFNIISKNNLGLNVSENQVRKALVKTILKMNANYRLFKWFFKAKKIKTIIIVDGYYGLEKANIIKAAKDLNIKVIEPQHGFINQNHPAYNYGQKIIESVGYKMYQPDLFLCYGKFWANSINIPNQKLIIGNPHLEKSLNKHTNINVLKKILVLGSGVTVDETIALLEALLKIKPGDYEIVYRPHPQERADVGLRYGIQIRKGVTIDEAELYFSMAESDIIIGELTTALFEAAALQKKTFLYDSSYTKTYFTDKIKYFKVFSLTNIVIIFDEYANSKESLEYYWAQGWQQAYLNLKKVI